MPPQLGPDDGNLRDGVFVNSAPGTVIATSVIDANRGNGVVLQGRWAADELVDFNRIGLGYRDVAKVLTMQGPLPL